MERTRPPTEPTTGFRWFVHVPSGWSVRRLRYSAILYSGGTPNTNDPSYWENGTIPWLSSGEINKKAIYDSEAFITPNGLADSSAKMVPSKSVLIALNGQGKTKATVACLEFPSSINQSLACIIPTKDFDYRYIYYFLESKYDQIRGLKGEDRDGLNMPLLKSIILPQPPLSVQKSIVSLLDQETSRIDALISKKEKQIELLQEKRHAIITKAVTKGIDPNAKMKDSGVEWIGNIPEAWEVRRLKYIAPEITVGIVVNPSAYYVEEGILCLRSLNISDGQLNLTSPVYISPDSNEYHRKSKLYEDDIVLVRTGKAGTPYVIPKELNGINCIDLLIVRKSKQVIPQFLYYVLLSDISIFQYQKESVGAIQAHFNTSTLTEMTVPLPTLNVQLEVVAFLDSEMSRLKSLEKSVRNSVDLLREYRSSLITAAVSGQIDISKLKNGAKSNAPL